MKVTATFDVEPADGDEYQGLAGKILTISNVDHLTLNTGCDITDDGNGGKVGLPSGTLTFNAHGDRAIWSEELPDASAIRAADARIGEAAKRGQ